MLGPNDVFGNRCLFGENLRGVRFYNYKVDYSAETSLSYNVCVGSSKGPMSATGIPENCTFYFKMDWIVSESSDGTIVVRRLGTGYEQRNLRWINLYGELRKKMRQEDKTVQRLFGPKGDSKVRCKG